MIATAKNAVTMGNVRPYQYSFVKKRHHVREIGIYESYNIIIKFLGNIDEEINDVSSDYSWIHKFVTMLNENDVDPIHLKDLVLDFMP